jgi:hypothetical protein
MGLFRRSKPATSNAFSPTASTFSGKQQYSRSNSTGTGGTSSSSVGSPVHSGFDASAVLRKRSSGRNSAMATLVDEGEVPKCPDPNVDPAGYLRSIHAVRERCMIVFEKARKNELNHFDVDWDKFDQTVKWVEQIIRVCIPAAILN